MTRLYSTTEGVKHGYNTQSFQSLIDAAVDRGEETDIHIQKDGEWLPYLRVIPTKPIYKLVPLQKNDR